jgi:DNA topoisomerase-3
LDGFKSPSGKAYSAILQLDGANLVRKSLNEQEDFEDDIEVNSEPLGKCPVDCNPSCQVVETARDFVCQTKLKARDEGDKGAAGFSFPRMLCKRMMKRDEIAAYITSGETPIIYDFISKRGRKFSAKLVMENEGAGFRFEFPPRGSKKKAGENEDGEEKSAQQTE